MMDKTTDNMQEYNNSIHRLGRLSSLVMIAALIAVPVTMQIVFGFEIDFTKTVGAVIAVVSYYGIVSCVEFISFAPILGAGGTYLSFITGNIGNLKLPAAVSAIQIAELETGTKEAEVVSVISIAISTFVTTGVLFVGMLLLSFLMPILDSPVLAPAFSNLMPALLGALAIPYLIKEGTTSILPVVAAAGLTLALGYSAVAGIQAILTPVFLLLAVLWCYILYRFRQKKAGSTTTGDES